MMARRLTLARDRTGTATIELALLAPVLAAMLIGLIDVATSYSDKLRLEQVAQRTIEKVQASTFTTSMKTALETEAETAAGTGSDAVLTYWLECDGTKMTGTTAYDAGCADGEAYARYVQLAIQKNYKPLIIAKFFGPTNPDGTITVHGTAGIRIQ